MFAAYLHSESTDCFVGQVFPVYGGWVMRQAMGGAELSPAREAVIIGGID